jgi:hypothetical protein
MGESNLERFHPYVIKSPDGKYYADWRVMITDSSRVIAYLAAKDEMLREQEKREIRQHKRALKRNKRDGKPVDD